MTKVIQVGDVVIAIREFVARSIQSSLERIPDPLIEIGTVGVVVSVPNYGNGVNTYVVIFEAPNGRILQEAQAWSYEIELSN